MFDWFKVIWIDFNCFLIDFTLVLINFSLIFWHFFACPVARFCEREPEAQGHQLLPTILDKISPISRSQHINSTHYFRPREGSRLRAKTIGQPDASRHYFRYREGIRLGTKTIGKPDAKCAIFWISAGRETHFRIIFRFFLFFGLYCGQIPWKRDRGTRTPDFIVFNW